jgi:acyl-CoA reductase-like NAD-dependent aldehyde dehydrogenase
MTNSLLFIDGAPRDSSDGKRIPQMNPATEEVFTQVAAATLTDVGVAVEGAHRAFVEGWRDLTPRKRTDVLFNIARLIRENAH